MNDLRERITHRLVHGKLSCYLDGQLDARDVVMLEGHIENCQVCRRDLATLRATVGLVQGLPQLTAPRRVVIPERALQAQCRVRRVDSVYLVMQSSAIALAVALAALVTREVAVTPRMVEDALAKEAAPVVMMAAEPDSAIAPDEAQAGPLAMGSAAPEEEVDSGDAAAATAAGPVVAQEAAEPEAPTVLREAPPETQVEALSAPADAAAAGDSAMAAGNAEGAVAANAREAGSGQTQARAWTGFRIASAVIAVILAVLVAGLRVLRPLRFRV